MKQKLVIIAAVLMLTLSAAPDAGAQWVQTTVSNGGFCFASLGAKLFVGSGRGIYCSTDSGVSWNMTSNGLPSNGEVGTDVIALAVRGANLVAETLGDGVFGSMDSGLNWTAAGWPNADVAALAVSGTNILAGTFGGVFLSTNNGVNWIAADSGLNSNVNAFAVSGMNLFAGTGGSVFLSTDTGTSWTFASNGLPAYSYVGAFAENGTNLFVATLYSSLVFGGGVFLSTDNGTSWTAASTGLPKKPYVQALAVSGSNLFAGVHGEGVYLSTNNGTSWQDVNTGLGDWNLRSFAVIGGNLIAGTDSGVWRRPLSQMINPSAVAAMPPAQNSITAYPNPFSQSTTISFSSPENGVAEVSIVNLLGPEVKRIFSGDIEAGEHSFTWDASGMPPGMYECGVRLNGKAQRIPIVLER